MMDRACEDKCYYIDRFVGAVRNLQTNELRNTGMLRLLEVADLCSRTVSDTANRLRKTRKKKSSAVPPFRSGHMSAICARLSNKGKVGVQRGRETMGVPSSLLPRRVPQSPAVPQRTLRPETANRSHGSGTPESLCREIFARKAHADQLSRRFPLCNAAKCAILILYDLKKRLQQ